MNTGDLLQDYLKDAEARGISKSSRQTFWYRLRHFAGAYPELPTSTPIIESFLRARDETPSKRGPIYKCLQAFYSWIEKTHGVKSPVPSKGKVGRPHLYRLSPKQTTFIASQSTTPTPDKLVQGGQSSSESSSTSTTTPNLLTRQVVDSYLVSRKNKGCTKATLDTKTCYLNRFVRNFEYIPLTAEPVSAWLNALTSNSLHKVGPSGRGKPLDQETKWGYQKELIALYHYLERRYGIKYPVWPEERIKLQTKVRPTLAIEDIQRLVKECQDKEETAIILTLLDSKIRVGELVSLDREKVFDDYMMVKGKTGERIVPIKPETAEALCRLQKKGPLFRVNGKRADRHTLAKRVSRLMSRAGLKGKKLGPHILRHSMSNLHIEQGGDLFTLQAELGHTSLRMTERYARLNPAQIRRKHQEYDVLGKVLGEPQAQQTSIPPGSGPVVPPEKPPYPTPPSVATAAPETSIKPVMTAKGAEDERRKGLSSWGNLIIVAPPKKSPAVEKSREKPGQLALAL